MLTIGLYLLKSCAYLLAFYIPFILIFKRTTFFTLNRVYLISGLLLSFVLPMYTGVVKIPAYSLPDLPFVEPFVTQTESVMRVSAPSASLSIVTLLVIVYVIGIALRLIQMTVSIARILKLKQEGRVLFYRNIKVVKTNTTVPFSFFNYVFLPEALDDPGILEHEVAHVRQYHWVDLLFVELVSVIHWFNPLMIFYKRSLKQQHEYLADQSAILSKVDLSEYLMSIKKQIELAVPALLISQFYFQSIKNRINMMTKKRTSVFGLSTYTIVLPLILFLLMAFSSRKDFQREVHGEIGFNQDPLSLVLPIDKSNNFVLESGYGERMHPVLGVKRLHTGIDLIANEGVPVIAAEDGVVVKAQMADAWGNIIVIQHEGTYSTSYSHLKSMKVTIGNSIKKGQVIGLVGNTGLSTKYHLHFELLENNKAIDPIAFLPLFR